MVPSVKEEADPLSEAKSQIWFIETFAKPLFELTASGIPGWFRTFLILYRSFLTFSSNAETAEYANKCTENLATWKARALSLSSCDEIPSSIQDTPSCSIYERERPLSPPHPPEDFVSAFPMALPTAFRQGVDQSDRSSFHDWVSFSIPSMPVLTDTDSSRASSPTHVPEPSGSVCPPSVSITSISTTSSLSSSSPSVTSTSHSAGLSDAPASPALIPPSHDGTLGLMVNVGGDNSMSSSAAIRAAYKVSVRKKPSFHRYSWSPGPRDIPAPREMTIVAGQGVDS
jgi:hypothetical protein